MGTYDPVPEQEKGAGDKGTLFEGLKKKNPRYLEVARPGLVLKTSVLLNSLTSHLPLRPTHQKLRETLPNPDGFRKARILPKISKCEPIQEASGYHERPLDPG